MSLQVTVTAKSGPDKTNTATVFTGLTGILFLPDRKVVQLFQGGDTNSPPAKEFDLTGVATCTATISGNAWAFAIS
jgi:hypothetical protein